MNQIETFKFDNPFTAKGHASSMVQSYHTSRGFSKWHFTSKSEDLQEGKIRVTTISYHHRDEIFARAVIKFDSSTRTGKEATFEELNADTTMKFEWIKRLKRDYQNWSGYVDREEFEPMPFCIDRVFEILELNIDVPDPKYRSEIDVRCYCPFHVEDGLPSFYYNRREGTWRCETCNISGGIYELIAKVHGEGEMTYRIVERMELEGLVQK